MMFDKLLSLDEQRLTPLFSDEDDRHELRRLIDLEEHPVLAEEPKLTSGDRVRPQGLHLPRLGQRVFLQPLESRLQKLAAILLAEPAEVVEHRFFKFHAPRHAETSSPDQNSGQLPV